MKQQKQQKNKQCKLNNSGFSLLEVLIAMIVLCLVSIPLIHSFATTAKTNGRAKVLMRATGCAENMMETFKYRKLDEMAERYDISDKNTVTVDANGVYTFSIRDVADLPVSMPDGYYMQITADPTLYPNANALNLADVKSMSITDSAVFNMSTLFDESIYEMFHRWNKEAHEDQSLSYAKVEDGYFKKNLTRSIEVTIKKKGTDTDEAGNEVDLVTVEVSVRYYFRSKNAYQGYLPASKKEYTEMPKEIFNNLTTKVPLSGVFLFYQPRYLATASGNTDNIIIYNQDNIQTNVFVAAQNDASDLSYKTQYFNAVTGPRVTIIENPDGPIADAAASVTLFTNLSEGAPYSTISSEGGAVTDGRILCNLTYQNPAGTQRLQAADAVKALNVKDLDGKSLTVSNTKNRIYKVRVTVYDTNGSTVAELDGTKLE